MPNGSGRDSDNGARAGETRAGAPGGEERRVAAWIGASLVIKGDLVSSEDTTVAGRVEGNVEVRQHALVVAPQARIHGDIVARSVTVHGHVLGGITATGKVEVGGTGSVDGDITTPRMEVAEGAVVHGRAAVGASS